MGTLRRRDIFRGLVSGLSAGFLPSLQAQNSAGQFKPIHPVKLISPLQAGGATDAIIRPIAQKLSDLWGQAVIVENKPGGGTILGTQFVAQATPDGHTFGVVISALTINPSLRNDLPYDTFKDLTPLTQIGTVTSALVAHPSLQANTLQEVIDFAKSRPGALSWASLGIGTAGHITGELLRKRTGIDIIHVPFAGSSGAYRELLPGRVQMGFVVLESALPHVKAGKLKVIALCDRRKNKLFPQIPLLDDTVKGLSYDGIFGLVAPANLPSEILKSLHADILKVLADPEIKLQLDRQSMDILASSPLDFAHSIRVDVNHWKNAVKESNANVS
jgi:tripartite-type tricarboxylate transporter receptor subunit TctC